MTSTSPAGIPARLYYAYPFGPAESTPPFQFMSQEPLNFAATLAIGLSMRAVDSAESDRGAVVQAGGRVAVGRQYLGVIGGKAVLLLEAADRVEARRDPLVRRDIRRGGAVVLDAVDREMSPKLAAHSDAIHLNAKLFKRVDTLYARRDKLGLDADEHIAGFIHIGTPKLDAPERDRPDSQSLLQPRTGA